MIHALNRLCALLASEQGTHASIDPNLIGDWITSTLLPRLTYGHSGRTSEEITRKVQVFYDIIKDEIDVLHDQPARLAITEVPRVPLTYLQLEGFFAPFLRAGYHATRYRWTETEPTPPTGHTVTHLTMACGDNVVTCQKANAPPAYMLTQTVREDRYELAFSSIAPRNRPLMQHLLRTFGETGPHSAGGGTLLQLMQAYRGIITALNSPIPYSDRSGIWLGRSQVAADASLFDTVVPVMVPGASTQRYDADAFATTPRYFRRECTFLRRWVTSENRNIWLLLLHNVDGHDNLTIMVTCPSRYTEMRDLYATWEMNVDDAECRAQYHRILHEAAPASLTGADLWVEYVTRVFEDENQIPMENHLADPTMSLCLAALPPRIQNEDSGDAARTFTRVFMQTLFPLCSSAVDECDHSTPQQIRVKCRRESNGLRVWGDDIKDLIMVVELGTHNISICQPF